MIKKLWALSRYSLLSGLALGLGFLRELVVSAEFGLSRELDVYLAMNGFYLFFGTQIGNALEMVFVSKTALLDTPAKVTGQVALILKALLPANILMLAVLYCASGYLIAWIFPGFDGEQRRLGLYFIANLLVAIVCANLGGVIRAGMNVMGVFWPGMIAGSVISLSGIVAVLIFGEPLGIRALLYGFMAGNALVFMMLFVVFIKRAEFAVLGAKDESRFPQAEFWKAVLVVLLGEVFYQGFSMTERGFASTFEAGTIAAFAYAWILVTIPLTLVVMPLSTVAYPKLAEAFGQDRRRGYRLLKRQGGWLCLFGLLVVMVISGYSGLLVKLVFMRGKFTEGDAAKTSEILSILVFALPFMSFGRLVRYSLYSIANYSAPVWALLVSWLGMAALALLLTPRHGYLGLAYASMIAAASEALMMLFLLRMNLAHTCPEPRCA